MKESLFKRLFSLVRYLARVEVTTTAGRINILGMLLGAPMLQIFVAFLVFTLICAVMIGYLEGPRSGQTATPPKVEERSESSDSAPSTLCCAEHPGDGRGVRTRR